MITSDIGRLPFPKPALQSLTRNAQLLRRLLDLEEFLVVDFDRQRGLITTYEYI